MKIGRWLLCKILNEHDWTSKVKQGIKPTKEEMNSTDGFWEYAEMYCEHCGKKSKLNKNSQLSKGYSDWKENGRQMEW